jgi:branched-chain amino acid transport system ATP-binding protein
MPASVSSVLSGNAASVTNGIFGVILVVIIVLEPGGLAALAPRIKHWTKRLLGVGVRDSAPRNPKGQASGLPRDSGGSRNGADAESAVLSVSNLWVSYGHGGPVIRGVDFAVPAGSVVGILGANGAGKSTLVRAISGFSAAEDVAIRVDDIRFKGDSVASESLDARARRGIALVGERLKLFGNLTVEENLRLMQRRRAVDFRSRIERVYELFPSLADNRARLAGYLSGGQRQMLAFARALLLDPDLLLVDEMSFGLDPETLTRLHDSLVALHDDTGLSMIVVEQNPAVLEDLADITYVMEDGSMRPIGSETALRENSGGGGRNSALLRGRLSGAVRLGGLELGGEPVNLSGRTSAKDRKCDKSVAVRVEDVCLAFGGNVVLNRVGFTAFRGDLVGLIGPNGSGKTSLCNVISGIYKPDQGSVIVNGRNVTCVRPDRLAKFGVARTLQGGELFPGLSTLENVMLGREIQWRSGAARIVLQSPLSLREERTHREAAREMLALVGLQDSAHSPAGSLSPGERKLVGLARGLLLNPSAMLLDEPLSGMTSREKEPILDLITRMGQELDIAVVLVEHDVNLVREFVPRVVVLDAGTVIADGKTQDVFASAAVKSAYLGVLDHA